MWWDNYTTKTEALRVILKLGIQTWKHKKCLNPFKRVYVETRQNQASQTETTAFHTQIIVAMWHYAMWRIISFRNCYYLILKNVEFHNLHTVEYVRVNTIFQRIEKGGS